MISYRWLVHLFHAGALQQVTHVSNLTGESVVRRNQSQRRQFRLCQTNELAASGTRAASVLFLRFLGGPCWRKVVQRRQRLDKVPL